MKNTIALIVSAVAIVLSVIAICVAVYRTSELGFDYQGVIVGVLALLVAILIGWQIWNAIRMQETADKIDENLNDKLKKYNTTVSVSVKLLEIRQTTLKAPYYQLAICQLMECLDDLTNGYLSNVVLHDTVSLLMEIRAEYLRQTGGDPNAITDIHIVKGEKGYYKRLLAKISHIDISVLQQFIDSLQEKDMGEHGKTPTFVLKNHKVREVSIKFG